MKKKNKEYYKNTLILLIGKFCTQFISFLLLPIFTRYLLSSDYGYVDLLQTYISLFAPVIILRIDSAVFRFLIDERKEKEKSKVTITNSIIISILSSIFIIMIYIVINNIINIKYFELLCVNIIVLIFSSVILQIARGLGNNLDYSIASIITGITNLIVNSLLIVKFNFDASSIFIASIFSNLICVVFLFYKLKINKMFSIKSTNKSKLFKMLKYSFPMIPNSLSWWIINVSDRSIISIFLGVSFNGIYTISCKFSNILNNIFSIFNMSWTETASLHIDDEDKNEFFSEMINKIFILFACVGLFVIAVIPLFYDFLIGKEYLTSYDYIPILIFSGNLNVLSWLFGGIYIAKKETKVVAKTTIYSAIINIIIHFVLIKKMGLFAACFSTLFSYLILVIYRYFDVKKYVLINLKLNKYIIIMAAYIIMFINYYIQNKLFLIIGLIATIMFSIIMNKNTIGEFINIVKNKVGVKNEKNKIVY